MLKILKAPPSCDCLAMPIIPVYRDFGPFLAIKSKCPTSPSVQSMVWTIIDIFSMIFLFGISAIYCTYNLDFDAKID